MGVGVLEFSMGSVVGGLWTGTIGWVLLTAAGAEARQGEAESGLKGLTIGQLMEPMTAVPDWLVVDEFVLRYVLPNRQSTFLLLGFDERPSGYVTIRDLSKVGPDDRLVHPVRRYAASLADVPVVSPHEPARGVLTARQAALRPVLALVVEDGSPVGIVTRSGMTAAIERARLLRSPRRSRD